MAGILAITIRGVRHSRDANTLPVRGRTFRHRSSSQRFGPRNPPRLSMWHEVIIRLSLSIASCAHRECGQSTLRPPLRRSSTPSMDSGRLEARGMDSGRLEARTFPSSPARRPPKGNSPMFAIVFRMARLTLRAPRGLLRSRSSRIASRSPRARGV
jgi:hypothetical protein